jgi:CheY-like chemotaxis protein
VVDDSRSARYILQRLLERQYIHVDGVGSAHEALSYLREYRPDVVFMDDMMPGMEGREVIDRLASNPVTAGIPIIMYTGREYPAKPAQIQRGSVIGVLSKPFTPQDVDALLAKLGGTTSLPVTAKLIRQSVQEPIPAADTVLGSATATAARQDGVAIATLASQAHLSKCVADAVDEAMSGLRVQLAEWVRTETQQAVERMLGKMLGNEVQPQFQQLEASMRDVLWDVRQELTQFQEQLLEQRVPQILEESVSRMLEERMPQQLEQSAPQLLKVMEQRHLQHMDVVQKTLIECFENAATALRNLPQ